MKRASTTALALLASFFIASQGVAAELKSLEVNVFPGGFNWPLWVAQDKGFFEAQGLQVNLIPTTGSIEQMGGLIDAKFDIAMTAIDNVIAYMEGQGEAKTENKPDLVAFMGVDNGFLSLMVTPDVKSFNDLKGKTLAVDAMTTGYAFVLRKMLELNGLKNDDYTFVKVGGMKQRYEALESKSQSGTLLVPPFTFITQKQGFNELGRAIEVLKHYQGVVAAARRDWLKAHEHEIVGFMRANIAAVDWLYEPKNKAEALQLFQTHLPNTSTEAAEQSYGILLDKTNGFTRKAAIDVKGVQTVMRIRTQYSGKQLPHAARYYDLSYYRKAEHRH